MHRASDLIKQEALRLGFSACGICKAGFTGTHTSYLKQWLDNGFHGEMKFMANHLEKRSDPRLLVENAKSIIVVALNYFPQKIQNKEVPQFARYAYGTDYHTVVKARLTKLYQYINAEIAPATGRIFCDSAPLFEKYHAMQAGIGWIGKHTQLIIPFKGSYFFLGEIVIDMELEYDAPASERCGTCNRCLEACPTNALVAGGQLNASQCLSYLTIEHKGELPSSLSLPQNRIYGCDICNEVCPWNRFAQGTSIEEFHPNDEFLNLTADSIEKMDEETFARIFKDSPVRRIGLQQLKRNSLKSK